MIRSLDDAWKWYNAVRNLALDFKKLAGKWDDPALADVLGRDNRLRDRSSTDLRDMAEAILADLDDLAVLVLFSVFEAIVRARAEVDVDRVTADLRHPAVLKAMDDLRQAIRNGGFARVTEAYQRMDVDLTAQINQVRSFRNWVAHGRRGEPKDNASPTLAMDRLTRYLDRLTEVEAAGAIEQPTDTPEPGDSAEV